MMYPKVKTRKKRKKHKSSILQNKESGICYLCAKLKEDYGRKYPLHEHHVYGGTNRTVSEENGFKVYLCLQHHIDGPEAVHNNIENMRIIQRDCQETYEKTHTRQQFMELIGRNYLDQEE